MGALGSMHSHERIMLAVHKVCECVVLATVVPSCMFCSRQHQVKRSWLLHTCTCTLGCYIQPHTLWQAVRISCMVRTIHVLTCCAIIIKFYKHVKATLHGQDPFLFSYTCPVNAASSTHVSCTQVLGCDKAGGAKASCGSGGAEHHCCSSSRCCWHHFHGGQQANCSAGIAHTGSDAGVVVSTPTVLHVSPASLTVTLIGGLHTISQQQQLVTAMLEWHTIAKLQMTMAFCTILRV